MDEADEAAKWTLPAYVPRDPPKHEAPDPEAIERDRRRGALDQLLRRPEALLERLDDARARRAIALLLAIACAGHVAYGVVVGSWSGGEQWWGAPVKIAGGALVCAAICFPSLYIFLSLQGAETGARQVAGILLGVLALTGVFLAGFAPVAWVFSQSSTTVALIAPIHLFVWGASLFASHRVLAAGLKRWRARRSGLTGLWTAVFVVTCLQMMTTLRPLIAAPERFLEPERMFFLQHWGETLVSVAKEK